MQLSHGNLVSPSGGAAIIRLRPQNKGKIWTRKYLTHGPLQPHCVVQVTKCLWNFVPWKIDTVWIILAAYYECSTLSALLVFAAWGVGWEAFFTSCCIHLLTHPSSLSVWDLLYMSCFIAMYTEFSSTMLPQPGSQAPFSYGGWEWSYIFQRKHSKLSALWETVFISYGFIHERSNMACCHGVTLRFHSYRIYCWKLMNTSVTIGNDFLQ